MSLPGPAHIGGLERQAGMEGWAPQGPNKRIELGGKRAN